MSVPAIGSHRFHRTPGPPQYPARGNLPARQGSALGQQQPPRISCRGSDRRYGPAFNAPNSCKDNLKAPTHCLTFVEITSRSTSGVNQRDSSRILCVLLLLCSSQTRDNLAPLITSRIHPFNPPLRVCLQLPATSAVYASNTLLLQHRLARILSLAGHVPRRWRCL